MEAEHFGVITVDGKLIDAPIVARARLILGAQPNA
jgi:citrate lyase beta subunit